jgi:hypothetical protein
LSLIAKCLNTLSLWGIVCRLMRSFLFFSSIFRINL